MSSTFHKYGGFSAVSRVVMTFYEMVLESDIVGHHFEDVDMPRLMDHQTKFVSSIMGGPVAISDDRLAQVHRRLNITQEEFDEIVHLLSEAMQQHGMDQDDVSEVARVFESKRALILKDGA
jgi:hemoglobin